MKYPKLLLAILILITSVKISSAQKGGLINSGDSIKKAATLYDSSRYKEALVVLSYVSRSDTNYVWSLHERAISCEADSQYTRAAKYCEEALALTEQREYEPDIYNTYGNIMDDMGQPEKAIKIFETAIGKYPSYSLLHFNKGIALMAMKRYSEAEVSFQKALMINPYMYSAHFQMAVAALQQGKIIQAYLGFIGYLLVNPEGRYWSKSINYLDKISKSADEVLEFKNQRTIQPDENYQTAEEILLSKIALDKGYKPIIALNDPISRQIQAVFEKLEYSDASTDFYIQYYLPYYKQVYNGGKFEPFINHIFSSVKIPIIQDYNKKNKKAIEGFTNEAAAYFNQLRSTRELAYNKRDTMTSKYLIEEGKLEGKGVLTADGKNLTGPWIFYYHAGNLKGVGSYNAAGQREGEWNYYYYSGRYKAKEHYKAGKLDGPTEYHLENGNLSSVKNYSNDERDGLTTTYYYAGNVKSTTNYKQGKKEGEEKEYYSNGNLQSVNNYVGDELTGPTRNYFKTGPLKAVCQYTKGKLEGPYKSYYESGALSSEGQMSKDHADGEWKFYYENGKIKEKHSFADSTEDGLHQEFYDNGQLDASYNVKKGKVDGEATYYYKDGKVFARYMHSNGIITSAKYILPSGVEVSAAGMRGDVMYVTTYNAQGYKSAQSAYNQNGELDGADTLFFSCGKISQINQYKNGESNGLAVSYYINGNKKTEVNMTDGKANGYYTSYYANGKVETEGWMRDGDYEGEWVTHDEKGRLSASANYLDGDFYGYREQYWPNGKKSQEEKYYRGWLERLTQFDSTGNVIGVDTFPKGSGKYKLVYPGGKLMAEGEYVNGDLNGPYKTYFFDGSLESSFFYKKGQLDSSYVAYHFGGIKNSEGKYKFGNKTGTWKTYDEQGRLYSTSQNVNDDLNGQKIYYFEDGTNDYAAEYKDDMLNGPGKKYDPDGTLAYQVIYENDRPQAYAYLGKDGKLVPAITIPQTVGLLKAYFPNGKLSRECNYKDGVKNGQETIYYTNGQIRSLDTTAYGISVGIGREYYQDGKLKSEYHYKDDNSDGICKEFYKKGTLREEISFENGVKHGPTKYYNENGKLVKTMWYYYGKLLSVKNE